jgi:hypothetical protein
MKRHNFHPSLFARSICNVVQAPKALLYALNKLKVITLPHAIERKALNQSLVLYADIFIITCDINWQR